MRRCRLLRASLREHERRGEEKKREEKKLGAEAVTKKLGIVGVCGFRDLTHTAYPPARASEVSFLRPLPSCATSFPSFLMHPLLCRSCRRTFHSPVGAMWLSRARQPPTATVCLILQSRCSQCRSTSRTTAPRQPRSTPSRYHAVRRQQPACRPHRLQMRRCWPATAR